MYFAYKDKGKLASMIQRSRDEKTRGGRGNWKANQDNAKLGEGHTGERGGILNLVSIFIFTINLVLILILSFDDEFGFGFGLILI